MAHWWGEGLWQQYGERLREFDRYPVDAPLLMQPALDLSAMDLPWRRDDGQKHGHDSGGALPDWALLDEFIARMPAPGRPGAMDALHPQANAIHADAPQESNASENAATRVAVNRGERYPARWLGVALTPVPSAIRAA